MNNGISINIKVKTSNGISYQVTYKLPGYTKERIGKHVKHHHRDAVTIIQTNE